MKKRYLSFSLIAVGLTILCSLGLIGLAKYVDSGYFKSANNVYRNDGVEIPAHDKTLKQNDDGTYELSLSVEGAIQPKKATANANILVIYDVSGSMSTTLSSYLYVKNDTGRYGLVDGNYVDLYYRNGNSYSAVGNNTISATTTVYTRSWQNNQWTYTEYKNDRYVRTNQRGPATEKVVYDFAKELYKYNETEESTNVEMALVTFSGSRNNGTSTNINAATIEQGWTNKESVFLGHLSNTGTSTKLTYGGGTNWEAAMQRALEVLGDADNDPTYVIFVTDGGPTYRINGGNGSDVDAANYIAARDDALLIRNYNTQTHTSDAETSNTSFYGIYAYGTEADYLDDLVYFVHNNGVERTAGTGTNTNGITGYYFKAEEQHELEAAIAQILEGIVQAIGVTEVSIVDGTTSEVSLTSGEIMHLLHIDESSFTYWMSKEVQEYEGTEDYDYYTDRIDRNNGEVFYVYIKDLGNNQLKCEWVRPSDNVNHSVTVTGYVEDGTATIQWKAGDSSSELFFNQEPPKAKVVNSAVEWDLSSVGTLLNGVTYTVKFDVWNTQTVFDLIADLENGVIQYSELAADANSDYAGLEDYIIQTCGSSGCSYRLATNTDAKLYYKDTRYSDELQEQSYEPPRGIDIVSETINIHKEWKNYYDDKEIPNSIDVALEEDGANYYSTTIRKSSGWSNEREIYISPGLMRIEYGIDPVTNKQIATSFEVLEPGHDYRFSELGSDLYNWQLVSETVHPMVINGVLTELVKIDSDMTTAFSLDDLPMDDYYIPSEMVSDPTLMYMTSDRGNHFVRLVSGGDVYLVNAGTDPTMEAYNYRRSNLNISKTVNGESADPDATFELTIVINDTGLSDGESLWFSVMDQNSNYVDLNERLTSSGWTKSASSSGSIYYYGDNNTTLKVLLKAGENLRFTNLTTEANFTITESNLTEHYVYDSISYTGTYGKSQVAIEDDKLNYSVNDSTKTITGKVNLTNAEFYVNVNNIYELINIEVEKEWDDNDNQDGKRPDDITVELNTGETVELSENTEWKGTFEDLPRFDTEGKEIEYTLTELSVEGYTSVQVCEKGVGIYRCTITNTHTPEKITVSVEKKWDDKDNQDGIRENSVAVNLLKGGKQLGETVTLDASNSWSYSWPDLDKYESGKEIAYTVEEIKTDVITGTDGVGTYSIIISGNKDSGYVITNKHTPETTSVGVVKLWDDNNNQDGIRESSVTVMLLTGGKQVGEAVTLDASNSWTYRWTGLDKYSQGVLVEYTVDEAKTDVITGTNGVGTYKIEISGNQSVGFIVKNVHTPETTSVSGEKIWDDANNQDGKRPESVTINLLADGEVVKTAVVDEDSEWKFSFTDLPVYKAGVKIVYTVDEAAVPEGYAKTISGNNITNKHVPETTSISGEKIWDDASNQDGKRPESVTINLLADGEVVKTAVVDKDTEWKFTFSDLPVYKAGKKIVYTVDEASVPEGYTKTISGNNITNKHVPETTSISGEKIWDDASNQDGKRPESIVIKLLADGEVVNTFEVTESGEWKYSFTDLPVYKDGKKIVYTVDEETVPEGYTKTISGNNITNKHVPEVTSVNGEKIWDDNNNQDGKRPGSVTINLLADGEVVKTVEVTEDDEWKFSFTNLPVYKAGKKIVYVIDEPTTPEGYTKNIVGNVVTNKHTPETTSVSGEKIWDDNNNQDGKRPESITINLLADGEFYKRVTIGEVDDWKYTFSDLPVYKAGVKIVYTVDEASVPSEYTKTISGTNITNKHTPETTSVSGEKIWDDNNNQDGKRPGSVTINLLADGEVVKTVVVNKDSEWKYSFTNLPVYNSGKKIVYKVDEASVPEGYTKTFDGNNIKNSYTPEVININGTKTWDDNNNQDGKRPETLTINLLADGEVYKSATISASVDWKYSFTDLPVYKSGKKIVYTIDEASVPSGYTKSITGYDITNKHTPETTNINGEKIWNDADNQDGKRPDSITVKLLADGEVVKTIEVDETQKWKYSFTDLPVYKSGKKIVYKIDEVKVPNYSTTYDGYNITNKYTPETTSVSVKKIWDDDDNRDNIRPTEITYNLLVNGEIKLSKTVTSEDNWNYTFQNLPVYSRGEKLVYTVTENEVAKYTTVITGNAESGFNVKNSYTPEKIAIEGTKVWNDNDNQDGKRPSSITITLYGDDVKVTSKQVTSETEWNFKFENLPKYDKGSEIAYSIKESTIEGYTSEITGNFKDGYKVTNTHTPIKIGINGEKMWVDSDDKDGLRPTSVTVKLLADGEVVKTIEVSESDEWKYSFTDLDKYKNQKEIKYTIEEVAVDKYSTTYDGYSIINTHTPQDVKVEGVKTWDDDENIYGRPDSITVRLTGKIGDEVVVTDSKVVTAEDEWKYSFTNLPEYKKGILIVYTITEDNVLDYSASYDGYNIKNTYTPKTVDFSGEKIWDDNDDQDGKRQESITINLLADGKVVDSKEVTADTDWKFEFTNKVKYANGKEIKYSVEEVKVEGYENDIETITDEESGEIKFVVSNTHTPEKISFKLTKQWEDFDDNDGIRPDELTVYLYKTVNEKRTLVKEQVISSSVDWTYEFKDLPKYEKGSLIAYDIVEEEVKGYVATVKDPVVVDDNNVTQLLINTHEPEVTKISGTKTWDDDDNRDGLRPDTITVYLYADGELVGTKELSEDTEWYYEFTDLRVFNNKEKVDYKIEEKPVDEYETEIDENNNIINKHENKVTSVSGTKTWDDNNNQDGKRPTSIVINLYADGSKVSSKTVTAKDNWKYTFDNLNKYRDGGVEIAYTIDENPVDGYTATYNGYNITNTHTPEKTSLTITKTWIDEDDKDELRPTSIVVYVYANSVLIEEVTITEDDEWIYTMNNLDKFKNGKAIVYTVVEEGLVGYEAVYNNKGNNIEIVNVHTKQTGDTDIIDPPHTSVEINESIHYPFEYVVIYDDRKKYRMI